MKPSEKEPVEELIEILSRPLNCPTRSLAELAELAESLHKDPSKATTSSSGKTPADD
jgi:hypothetical protein